uniref:P53 and DNA damage-regulated protein 1 n=1 Tax=Haemonchus contortus TaxID=6289 RepID=A0A7I4YCC1_HAECO
SGMAQSESLQKGHLASVFRSLEDSCLASERVQDSSSKLIELDLRRQKIREASRLLKNPRQDSTTWMVLTEDLMMEFSTPESIKILQDSMRKTEDDYALVNKQIRDDLNKALKTKSSKDLDSRGFTLKPINK